MTAIALLGKGSYPLGVFASRIVGALIIDISVGLRERVGIGLAESGSLLEVHRPLTVFPSPLSAVWKHSIILLVVDVAGVEIFVVAGNGVLHLKCLKQGHFYSLLLTLVFAYPLAVNLCIRLVTGYAIIAIIDVFARFNNVAVVVDLAVDGGFCAVGCR